ncbi:hypothetical protein AAC387_Pa07g0065 [Persea americana]
MEKETIPSVSYWNNPSNVLSNALEGRLGEVKVRLAAPPPWWAEISAGDHNGPWEAPLWVIDAPDLITRSAAQPIVEEGSAQSCCVDPILLTLTVSTIPTYTRTYLCPYYVIQRKQRFVTRKK